MNKSILKIMNSKNFIEIKDISTGSKISNQNIAKHIKKTPFLNRKAQVTEINIEANYSVSNDNFKS